MKLSQFEIGTEFLTPVGNRWRCTDIGTRTIVGIRLDLDHDPTFYNGPPYGIAEYVFDEDIIPDLRRAPRRRTFDDSGRARIAVVPRT